MTRDRLLRDGKMNLTGMKGMNGIGEDANPLSPLYPFPVAVGSPNHAACRRISRRAREDRRDELNRDEGDEGIADMPIPFIPLSLSGGGWVTEPRRL